MTSQNDIDTKIAQLETDRTRAQRAENQRLAATTENQRSLSQIDAELSRLRRQKEEQAIDQIVARSIGLADTITTLARIMLAKLEANDLNAAWETRETIEQIAIDLVENNKRAQDAYEQALNRLWPEAQHLAHIECRGEIRPFIEQNRAFEIHGTWRAQFEKRLPAVPDIRNHIRNLIAPWVQAVPEGLQRQFREGTCWSLTRFTGTDFDAALMAVFPGRPTF